jgi:hypothetical protein
MINALTNAVNKNIVLSDLDQIPLLMSYTAQVKKELDELMAVCDINIATDTNVENSEEVRLSGSMPLYY